MYAAGPSPTPLSGAARFDLIDELLDARALVVQPLHSLLACSVAQRAVKALYSVRGWWDVKRQHWLADLHVREPGAAQELRHVLTATDARTRQAALDALCLRVTGDLEYRDGASDPQPVP